MPRGRRSTRPNVPSRPRPPRRGVALAALAEARGRLSGSAADGGVARAVAAGALQARRLVDCVRIADDTLAGAVAAALEERPRRLGRR